jgi:serine protease Do
MKRWSIVFSIFLIGALVGAFALSPYHLQGQAPSAPVIAKEITSYRDIVKKVLPAVVSIEGKAKPLPVKDKDKRRRLPPDDRQIPEEFRRFFEQLDQDEGNEIPQLGFGSGFLVDPKGVILTNYHVVEGADQVVVELSDGRKFTSRDIHYDAKTDLAIVRITDKQPLPYLEFGDSRQMEIGDRVLAVGAPFGLTGTVTAGIISAKGRNLRLNQYEDFLQTDAAINPGNSGGPLINLEGKVIGITSAIKSRTGGFQGVGLAISSFIAEDIAKQLLKDGTVHRGYLGVQIKDIESQELADRLGVATGKGVVVSKVFDKGPGAKGGLQDGDVITTLAGKSIADGRELQKVVASLPLGKPTEVAVVRDGKPLSLKITIEEQPANYGTMRVPVARVPRDSQTVVIDKIGAEAMDMSPDMAEKLGYKETAGAYITRTSPDGLAADAGLVRGMMVTRIDKKPVTSAEEFKEMIGKASLEKGVLLQVYSPQGSSYVLLKKAVE